MMDCKKALQECGGDMEEAAKFLKVFLFQSLYTVLRLLFIPGLFPHIVRGW